jgi:hypothetical protein
MPALQAGTSSGEVIGDVLSREWLQAEVEARNPSLEAMMAAWQAAAQRYPQQIALDDPMLMGMLAPQSAASNTTETAYAFQLNQKLPWFGKRRCSRGRSRRGISGFRRYSPDGPPGSRPGVL